MAKTISRKRKSGLTIINRKYFNRRRRAGSSSTGSRGISVTETVLLIGLGLGTGYLVFNYFLNKGKKTTTTPSVPAAPANQYCLMNNELVERRINGNCSCDGCKGLKFNFKNETI